MSWNCLREEALDLTVILSEYSLAEVLALYELFSISVMLVLNPRRVSGLWLLMGLLLLLLLFSKEELSGVSSEEDKMSELS
jgi:hypothetical protein